ncbi:S8 family serine peptidase [Planomicrobium sp. CPCC 101079]|uniref:S8 family peptidase n=1 Tax=Planomicrobium sp. CPCC 101079 TaxID=2599618 RepID=UPI0011B55A7C|nr:S8 family serine peptidase [Planomicrobium sp. CPCC 101079]TWT14523.1 S8 family serine peptidase [Planomicrobium sp. CPCC 101079]
MRKSGKFLTTAILTASLLVPGMAASANGEETASQTNNNEKFRVLIDSTNQKENKSLKERYGVKWDFAAEGFTTEMNESQFNALQKNKNLTIEKVPEYTIEETSSKPEAAYGTMAASQSTPWGIKAIYNNSTLTQTSGGAGINVAVLDTGVNADHPDLENNVEQCKDFTTASSIVNGSCVDRQGHGTHVAGTALADGGASGTGVYGVAPSADLWAYKVLGDDGSGYSDDIATAIRHVADQATALNTKVVINMSLGSSAESSLITNAVNYAYSKGVLIIAAAGNSGPYQGSIGYPGALQNAVAVAALENVIQNSTYRVADFSSRGYSRTDGDYVIQKGDVEISAPGAAVYSTWYDGGYATISGTSMASPHAAGLAAKVWASNPTASNTAIRSELQRRAKLFDIRSGYGAATGDDYASGFGFARVQ